MVVFTCSYCGDSIKKNQVEKHYYTKCKGAVPAVTCVDCLKDFNEEYVAHTTCISEEERYSAKGFVGKAPSDKGKKKQENWLQFIKNLLSNNEEMNKDVKRLLQKISSDQGVPQKESSFVNFCTNKLPYEKIQTVKQTWDFLQEQKTKMHVPKQESNGGGINNSNCQEDKKRKRVDSNHESSFDNAENCGDQNQSKVSQPTNLKSKKKKGEVQVQNCFETNDPCEESVESISRNEKKTEKKRSHNGHNVSTEELTIEKENNDECLQNEVRLEQGINVCESGDHNQTSKLSKKERKEKRKKEKYERQLLEIQQPLITYKDDDTEVQSNNLDSHGKRKKKKNKLEDRNTEEHKESSVKNKSKKENTVAKCIEEEVVQEHQVEVDEVKTTSKFNWEETVVKVLESKGELPLKRVEKKVVNEFMNSGAHVESIEKVIAKFNKKIMKMSRVKVKKDVVKLVS